MGMARLPGRRYQMAVSNHVSIIMWWAAFAVLAMVCVRLIDGTTGLAWAFGWLAVPLVVLGIQKRRFARYTRAVQAVFVSESDPVRAERELGHLDGRFRWPASIVRTTAYYRALAVLRQGRLDDAISILAESDGRGGFLAIDASFASALAFAHALSGDVDAAQAWLAEATVRRRKHGQSTVELPDLGAEVVIELRRGRFREVAVRLADLWPEMERAMTGERLARMRVLRAFAVAQGDVREAGAVGSLLAGLQPGSYDAFAFLSTKWPELDLFLRSNLR